MGTSRKYAKLMADYIEIKRRATALHMLLNKHQWVLANMLNDMSKATASPPLYTCKMDVEELANGSIHLAEDDEARTVTAAWYPKKEETIVKATDAQVAALSRGILQLHKP